MSQNKDRDVRETASTTPAFNGISIETMTPHRVAAKGRFIPWADIYHYF